MPAQTTSLTLRMSPGARAIARLLACCARRGLDVTDLRWSAAGGEARAELVLSGEPAQVARAALWLERLVEVLEVRDQALTSSSTSSPGSTTRALTPASRAALANASPAASIAS
jgi:acetolactate synthase small subunit